MATAVLFIGWNHPHPGHEKDAYGFLMREGAEYLKKLQSQGWFERVDNVGLTPHGGGVHGFILLHGERAKLDELRRTDEFERFSMRLGRWMSGYSVVPGVTGEGLAKVAARNPDILG